MSSPDVSVAPFLCGWDKLIGQSYEHRRQHRQRSRGGLRVGAQEAAAECRRAWV